MAFRSNGKRSYPVPDDIGNWTYGDLMSVRKSLTMSSIIILADATGSC